MYTILTHDLPKTLYRVWEFFLVPSFLIQITAGHKFYGKIEPILTATFESELSDQTSRCHQLGRQETKLALSSSINRFDFSWLQFQRMEIPQADVNWIADSDE